MKSEKEGLFIVMEFVASSIKMHLDEFKYFSP